MYDRNDHFLKRDAPMLKSILVMAHVVIVIVGVSKEIILHSKHIGRGYIQARKFSVLRAAHFKNFSRLKIQVSTLLVTQVGGYVFVPNDLVGPIYSFGTVVRG